MSSIKRFEPVKLICLFLMTYVFLFGVFGCSKYQSDRSGTSSFGIVNVIAGGSAVALNSAPRDSIGKMSYRLSSSFSGNHIYFSVYRFENPATLYFGTDLNASDGDLYTLLLSGSIATKVDAFFYREVSIPKYTDSVAGVRFINLVQNGNPISVNIRNLPAGSAVGSLSYQQIGTFGQYQALKINSTYTFEIRDAQTGELLDTYILNTPRFNSCTLIWKGMIGGTGNAKPGILRVDQPAVN